MSEQSAPEPTMEEILASIRRIISEDDAPADAEDPTPEPEAAPEPVAAAAPAPEPEPEPEPEDDVLELTERVEPPEETHGDLDVYTRPEPEPAPAPEPAPVMAAPPPREEPPMFSSDVPTAARSFDRLAAAISMPPAGRSLEDVVRELLAPMMKDWLDEHLATIVDGIVAERVEAELERIKRSRVI